MSRTLRLFLCVWALVFFVSGQLCAQGKDATLDLPVLRNVDLERAIRKTEEKGKTGLQKQQELDALSGRRAELTGEILSVGALLDKDKRAEVTIWCADTKIRRVTDTNGMGIRTWIPVTDAAKMKIGDTLRIACTVTQVVMGTHSFGERPRRVGPMITVTFGRIR